VLAGSATQWFLFSAPRAALEQHWPSGWVWPWGVSPSRFLYLRRQQRECPLHMISLVDWLAVEVQASGIGPALVVVIDELPVLAECLSCHAPPISSRRPRPGQSGRHCWPTRQVLVPNAQSAPRSLARHGKPTAVAGLLIGIDHQPLQAAADQQQDTSKTRAVRQCSTGIPSFAGTRLWISTTAQKRWLLRQHAPLVPEKLALENCPTPAFCGGFQKP